MKIVRTRVSAVILKDKKLLLLKGDEGIYKEFYFTPGGKVEEGESQEAALRRELGEELRVEIKSFRKYFSYTAKLQNTKDYQQIDCYLTEINEEIKLSGEITLMWWYGREDYVENKLVISESTYQFLIPKLIEDGLI